MRCTTPVLCTIFFVFLVLGLLQLADQSSGKEVSIATPATQQTDADLIRDDVVANWMVALTLKEKCELLRGSVDTHGYTGFVPGVPRLGIPSLRMNDGPQGFRGPKKTSTAWPCGLAMATTFWPELVYQVAEANGKEFIQKGSNVFLGPGMNLARIAGNGRNFEYLCGEDPLLGEVMADSYVRGIQSNDGLIATAKHFINNDQETDRTKVNSIVDEETQWNMYYRPFLASVKAGVDSIMCSYNRINGHQGCASQSTIQRDLEGNMGFQGFVMSDWFAVTGTVDTALAGTDVEMPIPLYYGEALKSAVENGKIPAQVVDDKVRRVLTTIVRRNVSTTEKFNPAVNVTNDVHSRLARFSAASSVVLLKNDNDVLPLSQTGSLKILVIGDRAQERVLSTGGGSGHVHPPYVISPLLGLQSGGPSHTFTYINTVQSMNLSPKIFASADMVFAVVGTSATEGLDRSTLGLDPNDVDMINHATLMNPKVVVCITAPGAILMPFFDSVQAVLLQFMPGQEAGNALADVVYGRVDPGGARLPLTMPRKNNEVEMTERQYPGVDFDAVYTERTAIGYRWYAANPTVKPLLPFGHGTSYASFKFLGATITKRDDNDLVFHLGFLNTSKRKGVIVPQIYVTKFPDAAAKIVAPIALVGFKRIEMEARDIKTATVRVKAQSLSVWTKMQEDFILFPGTYEISIGSSSTDFWKTMRVDIQADSKQAVA
jgi:beta-glucosidase